MRIIGPVENDFPLPHSTRLYPEWPFAKARHTSDKLAQQVVIALLDMPPDNPAALARRYAGWTVPLDYRDVHQLLLELRGGPYEDYGRVSFSGFLQLYWHWFLLGIIGCLGLVAVTGYVARLNRRLTESKKAVEHSLDTLEAKVKDRTSELEGVVKQLEDEVDERKRSEEELRNSEIRLKEAQKIARLGQWELDLVSNTLYWSEGIYRLFEIDPEKFPASYGEFLMQYTRMTEHLDKAYKDSLRNKTQYNIDHRLLLKDGTIKYVNEICYTQYDEDGNPLRSLGTVQDITGRHFMEEELKKHREHLEHLVKERTAELEERNAELEEKNAELERMNNAFVGREFRIKELRDRVKELELTIDN